MEVTELIFELQVSKAYIKGVFSRSYCCYCCFFYFCFNFKLSELAKSETGLVKRNTTSISFCSSKSNVIFEDFSSSGLVDCSVTSSAPAFWPEFLKFVLLHKVHLILHYIMYF